MKKIILISFLTLLISCSEESTVTTTESVSIPHTDIALRKTGRSNLGEMEAAFAEIYFTYLELADKLPHGAESIPLLEALALENSMFDTLYGVSYKPVDTAELADILVQSQSVSELLDNSSLSGGGKQRLEELITTLYEYKIQGAGYSDVAIYLKSFKTSLSEDAQLPEQDAETLRITTCLLDTAFEVETRRRRRDRDWELSVGHIAATLSGSGLGEGEAIVYSLGGKHLSP